MATKIVLGLVIFVLLYVSGAQNATIMNQQQTIRTMAQNPACLIAPVPKHSPIDQPLIREQ